METVQLSSSGGGKFHDLSSKTGRHDALKTGKLKELTQKLTVHELLILAVAHVGEAPPVSLIPRKPVQHYLQVWSLWTQHTPDELRVRLRLLEPVHGLATQLRNQTSESAVEEISPASGHHVGDMVLVAAPSNQDPCGVCRRDAKLRQVTHMSQHGHVDQLFVEHRLPARRALQAQLVARRAALKVLRGIHSPRAPHHSAGEEVSLTGSPGHRLQRKAAEGG